MLVSALRSRGHSLGEVTCVAVAGAPGRGISPQKVKLVIPSPKKALSGDVRPLRCSFTVEGAVDASTRTMRRRTLREHPSRGQRQVAHRPSSAVSGPVPVSPSGDLDGSRDRHVDEVRAAKSSLVADGGQPLERDDAPQRRGSQ